MAGERTAVPRVQHDHVVGRGPQPGHESGDVVDPGLGPPDADPFEELEPELQARRIGALGVRRTLQRREVRQVVLDRFDRLAVVAEHRPRHRSADRHHHLLDDQPEAPKANIRSTIALAHRYVEDSARQVERTRSPLDNRCPGRYIEDIAAHCSKKRVLDKEEIHPLSTSRTPSSQLEISAGRGRATTEVRLLATRGNQASPCPYSLDLESAASIASPKSWPRASAASWSASGTKCE